MGNGSLGGPDMSEKDPTQQPEFKRVLHNLLTTPHKPQSELKVGKAKPKAEKPARKPKPAKGD